MSKADPKDNSLDVDVLRQALERYLPPENASPDDQEHLSDLLDELQAFGVNTESELGTLLKKHVGGIKRAESEALRSIELKGENSEFKWGDVDRLKRGVFFTYVGLARQGLRAEFGDKYNNYSTGMTKRRKKGGTVERRNETP